MRFIVQKLPNDTFYVQDTEEEPKDGLLDMACALYFTSEDRALTIASILNIEWELFISKSK